MHTPGPWHQDTDADDMIFSSAGQLLAMVTTTARDATTGQERWTAEASANARLIAAAPELLDALRGCVEVIRGERAPGAYARARALLARVEG